MSQTILDILRGDLSTEGRIWGAIWPAVLLFGYFIATVIVYSAKVALRGKHRDAEVEARGSSALLGMNIRLYFSWVMSPVWRTLKRLDIPPNAVTTLSVFIAAAAGVSMAVGRFALGGWLYLLSGACDFIDGRLARETGRVTRAGAALDSILDRYSESAVLIGLAWFYRDSAVLLAVLATLVGSFFVSYVRARGEGLGVSVKVGLMQRPERMVLLGASVALSPVIEAWLIPADPRPLHRLAVLALMLLAVTTNFTAGRRFAVLLGKLDPVGAARWKQTTGQGSILRTVVAAVIATGCDFAAVLVQVSVLGVDPRFATAMGCVVGGVINFLINRVWTFGSTAPAAGQAGRYVFVSASSAVLNSGGVAVLLFVPGMDYRLAWTIARVAVFGAWNYPLQRDYVFGDDAPTALQEAGSA